MSPMTTIAASLAEPPSVDAFEEQRRRFFAGRAVDLDAQAVVFGLFAAQAAVFSASERLVLRPMGLTHAGFTLMMALWMFGPAETRVVAKMLGVSRPAVVSTVNTLESRRLVKRRRSRDDRRLVTIALTPAGQLAVEKAQGATHAYERRLTASMSKGDKRELVGLLRVLQDAARSAEGDER
jgi:DNA-binding MarR family transcriptional regulator